MKSKRSKKHSKKPLALSMLLSSTALAGTPGPASPPLPPAAVVGQAATASSSSNTPLPTQSTTSLQDINQAVTAGLEAGLSVVASANSGSASGASLDGADAQGLIVDNQGSITLSSGTQTSNAPLFGIMAVLQGGNGATASDGDNGGNGGSAGTVNPLSVTNSGHIDMSGLSGLVIQGGAGIDAQSRGGNGAGTTGDHNPAGAGGNSAGAALTNSGDVTITVQGTRRFIGLQASSNGGDGADQYNGGSNTGGNAGTATVTNSGHLTVDWTWTDADMSADDAALYGILAQAQGGDGGDSTSGGLGNGGAGGSATSAVVTLQSGGSVGVIQRGAPPNANGGAVTLPGAGVAAMLLGGDGGNGLADEDHTQGGNGGDAGVIGASSASLQIVNTDTSVTTSGDTSSSSSGDKLPALLLWAEGGAGAGAFNDSPHYSLRTAGDGGKVGDGKLSVTAASTQVTLSTNGNESSAIQTRQQGGAGGNGGPYHGDTVGIGDTDPPGNGGSGGEVGSLELDLTGSASSPVVIHTAGASSHGIASSLLGGTGGAGGEYEVNAGGQPGGTGGAGGGTGAMTITLESTSITTGGSDAFGILAQSRGANGGWGGDSTGDGVTGGPGGAGGSTSTVTVTLDAGSSVTTQGQGSIGIVAQTASGAGGGGGQANGVGTGSGGNGGAGGNSGAVTVDNSGQVTTQGQDAIGILAQSVAGAGGSGAGAYGIFDSTGGMGGSAGSAGTVTVSNAGTITTHGNAAVAVVAQSIGGSGGSGGTASGLAASLGGSSTTNPLKSNGNDVTFHGQPSGSLSTSGASALGLLAQSIGGGGGVGGGSEGAVSVGASGGAGGAGGGVTVNLASFRIGTAGDSAHALVAQSIGGGGGNAGNANSLGVFSSIAIGQSGGSGGDGGGVVVNLSNSNIVTEGSKAAGIVGQSIGGGGGTGGRAFASAVGVGYAGSVALGGQGGEGGDGGVVSSQIVGGSISTGQASSATGPLPVDAFGAVIQSIGGGGGLGGNATADAIADGLTVGEDTQISLTVSVSLGGTGGVAGDGDYVTFATSNGAQLTTQGQGSHGVLIQSIGGGGGAGGDSSSMAASMDAGEGSLSLDASFAMGASGGAGGDGGSVWAGVGGLINVSGGQATFTPDATNAPSSTITTYGDYANAITAQSIGGGGGNAGFGSANTQAFGSGSNLSPSIGLGGSGGGGGKGGLVQVEVMPLGVVQTWGSGAIGVLAQSIGGGGGASQGGSFTLSGTTAAYPGGMTLNQGNQGGQGNTGGEVKVAVSGSVTTQGGDAPAIQAQSIGGGGGQGGSAGSDASFDNPVTLAEHARTFTSSVASQLTKYLSDEGPGGIAPVFQTTVSLGGKGGSGNTGDAVEVTVNPDASLITQGDWSTGVFAQSVGGGGGKGGNGFATGSGWVDPAKFQINTNLSLGGDGGAAGDGGTVTTTLNSGTIGTSGFGAAGVLAQSVGGGGGHGADGSDGYLGTVSLGLSDGGSAGTGGAGGAVTLQTSVGSPIITTGGEAAFGVALQSVGGGGGFAGTGTSIRAAAGDIPFPAIRLTAKSANNQSGSSGGTVTLTDDAGLKIGTQGNNAYGVVAQSVGGGGGIIINSQNQQAVTGIEANIVGATQTSSQWSGTDGGNVTVNLAPTSLITTTGTGAHGVVAQSVGGGGGIVGLPGTGALLSVDSNLVASSVAGVGEGGNVSVTAHGNIAVDGPGAVGILAQSVTGAGGLLLSADGQTVYAGRAVTGASSTMEGSATVDVTVAAGASVAATGPNSIGIFAQNSGSGNGVTLTVDGMVTGGSMGNDARAIWVDSSGTSTLTISGTGSVTDGATAIFATGGPLNVTNDGLVQGSTSLSGGTMGNSGQYVAGAQFEGNLVNQGQMVLGGREGLRAGPHRADYTATNLTGSLTQSSAGTLRLGADFNTGTSDTLHVKGSAHLDGSLHVTPRALLPNRELAILTVDGNRSGTLAVRSSPVFNFATREAGNTTHVRVTNADFNANAMQLSGNQRDVTNHLQQGWNQGGSAPLSTLYAVLDAASQAGAGEYQQRISDLSPGVALAPAAQMQLGMARFTHAMMSCPRFGGEGAAMQEQECLWGEVSSRHTKQDGGNATAGFSYDSVTYQIGGQRRIAPNWFLGGSAAYQHNRLRGDDQRVSGSGGSGYAGVVLKREAGAWTFSGALGAGYGSLDVDRQLSIPGYDRQATSRPDVYSLGARLRAAHTVTRGNVYVKPYVDVTATYSRMPAHEESGDALRLKVDSSDQVVLGVAPTVEVGGRVDLPKGIVLRPFAYAGVSLLSEDGWKTSSRLAGAPSGTGQFDTTMPTAKSSTRVGAGVQVTNTAGVNLRLQYDGEFSSRGKSHSGMLKLSVPF